MSNQDQPKTKKIKVQVPRPKRMSLWKYVMARFLESSNNGQDLNNIVTKDVLSGEIATKFPESKWNVKQDIHYSYYKSKFLTALDRGIEVEVQA